MELRPEGQRRLPASLLPARRSFRMNVARGAWCRNRIRLGGGKGFASFAGELGDDQVVGSAKERRKFRGRKGVARFQGNPFRASQIRRWDNTGALGELGEILGRHFERKTNRCGDERGDGKHFAADLEEEVVAPLDLFGGAWKGQA